MENMELQESSDLKKGKYVASVKRDEKLLKTFVKFSNQARHPRTTVYMITVGAMLIALPIANKGIALPGSTKVLKCSRIFPPETFTAPISII